MNASYDGPGEQVPMLDIASPTDSETREFYERPVRSRQPTLRLPFIIVGIISVLALSSFSLFYFPQQQVTNSNHAGPGTMPADQDHHEDHDSKPDTDHHVASTSVVPDITTSIAVISTSTSVSSSTSSSTSTTQASPTETLAVESGLPLPEQFDLKRNFVVTAKATVREYTFNITHGRAAPDGFEKTMILVNGQSPGPLIQANTGDTIRVHVNNMMTETSTTLHWHGIDQRNTTWMDGVHSISQCGIPPGQSFTYEFTLVNQRGTFWYHAHKSVQYTDGLYGPVVIHDPTEAIAGVDQDKIVMVGDLYHDSAEQILKDYLGPSPPWKPSSPGIEPPAKNIIINGRNGKGCTGSSMACENGTLHSTHVDHLQRIRLRLISHSTNVPLYFSVDSHLLEIVELDGVEIEPIRTSRVFINPGQRYSVVLTANQTAGNYLMRASAAAACFHIPGRHMGESGNAGLEAHGVLAYGGVDVKAQTIGKPWDVESSQTEGIGAEPWSEDCADLPFDLPKPKRVMAAYNVSEQNSHYFRFKMSRETGVMRTSVNETTYTPLVDDATVWKIPHLDLNAENPKWDFGPNQQVMISPDPSMGTQIAISANHMMMHPWHMQYVPRPSSCIIRQSFQVVGWGDGNFGKGQTTWKLDNPMRRDTLTMMGADHVVLRIASDNPGVWALHCHILWHAEGRFLPLLDRLRLKELQTMLGGLAGPDKDGIKERFCKAPAKPEEAHVEHPAPSNS
ncbi:unnamed protein product [Clonostachys rosea f. rosea IK726]|uniref:Laccase n=2 Tax=Bionectria ochroleuca TaxID=29856 RepID=A0A0B7JU96_BIOOC|nr:unnamed protein product [Clonostachys rosea f. rosea IK726]